MIFFIDAHPWGGREGGGMGMGRGREYYYQW
jgi:hypothetical protein